MSTIQAATDQTLVNRAGVDHHITLDKMSTLQDTDLLLVNRAGVDYKCTAKDIKSALGGGGALDPAVFAGQWEVHVASEFFKYVSKDSTTFIAVMNADQQSGATHWMHGGKTPGLIRTGTCVAYETPYGYQCNNWTKYLDESGTVHTINSNLSSSLFLKTCDKAANEVVYLNSQNGAVMHNVRLPYYGNGWWYLGVTDWMHYATADPNEATCNNPSNLTHGNLTLPASAIITNLSDGTALNAALGLGVFGKDGARFVNNAKVFLWDPIKHGGAFVEEGAITGTGINGVPAVIGDYVFFNFGSKQKRNTTKGDYSHWTDVHGLTTADATYYYAYVNKKGTFYMFGQFGMFMSKDEGLNWTKHDCLTGIGQTNCNCIFIPTHELFVAKPQSGTNVYYYHCDQ